MAWTAAQLAKARKLYKKGKAGISWNDAIKRATKGGKVSGTGKKRAKKATKKAPAKRVTVVKAKARKVVVNTGGSLGSIALQKIKSAQTDAERLKKKLATAKTATERKQIRGAISGLNKFKNAFKKFL